MEKSLPPISCDGDAVPNLAEPGRPNGERATVPEGSIGDVLAVEEPDFGTVEVICGR